jgi:HEAT repeat protein
MKVSERGPRTKSVPLCWALSVGCWVLGVHALLLPAHAARLPEPVPSASAQMFEQLNSKDWILQAEALDYLSRYDVPAAGPVRAIVKSSSGNRWLQARAIVALTRISPTHAVPLATSCSTNPVVELRVAAAEICCELPAAKAAPIIKKLVAEKTPLVKYNALAAHARHLGKDAWKAAAPAMTNIPANCIEPATRALGWIGTEPALAKLGELARQDKLLPAMQRGLQGVKNPALAPFYLELATVAKGKVPIADIWQGLESCGNDAVIAACRQALATGDNQRVTTVSRLMARFLTAPELGKALKTALAKATDPATLTVGLAALSSIDADIARDVLLANLEHENAGIRTLAIRSLAQDKAVNLYDVLEKMLADPESSVRVEALRSLRNASDKHVPRERLIEYFEPSLLSKDKATRAAAIAAIAPSFTRDNGETALGVLKKMQDQYGVAGAEPLMRAVFRTVPEEKAAALLEAHGYVTRWHAVGTFPTGWAAMGDGVDGMKTVYPPEKNVDLKQSFTVVYNHFHYSYRDKRSGKKQAERVIGWGQPTVVDADGLLYLARREASFLPLPLSSGVSYAYTEIVVPRQTDVRMNFLFNNGSQSRIWLNGKELKVKSGNATLNAGKNRILVKLLATTAGRTMRLHLTDAQGKPLERSYE